MPLAKIREERARLLRDDDEAVLPGSPTTRQRAPGGTGALCWFVLYALGGTLYVMLLFVILNHQQAVRSSRSRKTPPRRPKKRRAPTTTTKAATTRQRRTRHRSNPARRALSSNRQRRLVDARRCQLATAACAVVLTAYPASLLLLESGLLAPLAVPLGYLGVGFIPMALWMRKAERW